MRREVYFAEAAFSYKLAQRVVADVLEVRCREFTISSSSTNTQRRKGEHVYWLTRVIACTNSQAAIHFSLSTFTSQYNQASQALPKSVSLAAEASRPRKRANLGRSLTFFLWA